MKTHFLLDNCITFLNHGSFGACPKPIVAEYQRLQMEQESDSVHFMQKKLPVYLKEAKKPLAQFIGCNANDFFFIPNPTVAVNTIMRSLQLQEGDEILTTNQEYGAMDRTWHFYCKKVGCNYIRQEITLPVLSKEAVLVQFWSGCTSKTKVIFINEISSATGLIFPVKEICDKARTLGITTIIDGAHVPGHIDLNIEEMNPDFYTGTLHKWMLAPKGSSFLYVKKEFQDSIDPLVVSWGYESVMPSESRFLDYHEYQGTNDYTAFLTTPKVIEFLNENDWKEKSKVCRQLVLDNYQRFCDLVNTKPICPITEEFLGQMASIYVRTKNGIALKEVLYDTYKIQVPVMPLNDAFYIRFSINVYNTIEDLDILYQSIADIIATTDLIDVA